MADVFVSYARGDEPMARQLASALTAVGWDVWWDRHIPRGLDFSQVIQHQLEHAKCVVVLWSKASIASEYARDEAAVAMERAVLVPALIEDVRPPLGFRQRQAANLTGWSGDRNDREYLSLVDAIARFAPRPEASAGRIGTPAPEVTSDPPRESPDARGPRPQVVTATRRLSARRAFLLSVSAIAVAVAAWWSWNNWWATPGRNTYRELVVTVTLGDSMQVRALYGTAAFYGAVNPKVVMGAFFSPAEMWSSPSTTPNVVLLSERFWRRELNADPSFLKHPLIFNSYFYSVRGVVSLPRPWDSIDILFPRKASLAPDF